MESGTHAQEATQTLGDYFPKELKNSGGEKNVGDKERVISSIAGGLLAVYGGFKRGILGIPLIIAGGMLAKRGLTGHCDIYKALGMNTSRNS